MEEIVAEIPVDPDQTAEEARTEAPTEDSVSAEAPAEGQPMGFKDFSPEERATIIAMARELGAAKVAREFGIKARLISYWVQQEKKRALKPEKLTKVKGKDSKRTLARKEAFQPEGVLTVAAEAVKAVEPVKANELAGRRAERTVPAKVLGSAEPPERSEEKQAQTDRQSLIIENAILKERVSALNAEIEKLRAALTSLM